MRAALQGTLKEVLRLAAQRSLNDGFDSAAQFLILSLYEGSIVAVTKKIAKRAKQQAMSQSAPCTG